MRFSIKQRNIQNLIEKRFPILKRLRYVDVILSDPIIVLVDGSERMGIRLKTTVIFANQWRYSRETYLDGEIEYQTDLGELFLKNTTVNFLLKGHAAKIASWPINKIVVKRIQKYMQRTPIYHFNQDDFIHKLAKSRVTDLKIENRCLVFEFKFF